MRFIEGVNFDNILNGYRTLERYTLSVIEETHFIQLPSREIRDTLRVIRSEKSDLN